MEPTTLLYLRLKLAHKEDYIDSQLQRGGFKLTKKKGNGLESFRNYYYEMTESPEALQLSFKLMPGKNTTQTVELSLSPKIESKDIEKLFSLLRDFNRSIPMDLLDLKRRNEIYEGLHKEGVVDAYYVGLSKDEQLVVEQQAYIPLDHFLFLEGHNEKEYNNNNSMVSEMPGERAPDLDV